MALQTNRHLALDVVNVTDAGVSFQLSGNCIEVRLQARDADVWLKLGAASDAEYWTLHSIMGSGAQTEVVLIGRDLQGATLFFDCDTGNTPKVEILQVLDEVA